MQTIIRHVDVLDGSGAPAYQADMVCQVFDGADLRAPAGSKEVEIVAAALLE